MTFRSILAIYLIGNSFALKCYQGNGIFEVQECPPGEIPVPEFGTKFVCASFSNLFNQNNATKQCNGDKLMSDLTGGVDACKDVERETVFKATLKLQYRLEKIYNPQAINTTEEEFIGTIKNAPFSSKELKEKITVCSCTEDLCNSAEANRKSSFVPTILMVLALAGIISCIIQ